MAKGLAVVSGSNDVVFKALETGVITLGSVLTDAEVTLTGSLIINKHADGGDPLIITGLSSSATSDAADKILVIDATTGVVRAAEKLSASDVELADGQTVEQFSGSVDFRLDTLEASVGTGVLVVSGSTEIEDVDLAGGSVRFLGTGNETDVTVTTSSAGNVVVTVGLVPDVTVNTLTASSGLFVQNGGLLVQEGGADITGDTTVDGTLSASSDLSSGGNLDVAGTANVGNTLTVESGGASITGDVSVIGNISGSGTLQIGTTSTLGGTVTVTTGDVSASNGSISASANLSAGGDLAVAGNAGIGGNLTVTGDLTILGETTILETANLRVEDPIIVLGSSSVAIGGDRGFIFQQDGGNQSFIYDSGTGKYLLGSTPSDGTTTDVSVTNDATLLVNTLSASLVEVSSDLNVQGNVTLGDASTDAITINGFITGSGSPIVVSSSLTIGDAGNVNSEVTTFVSQVRMPIYTISGDALEGTFPAIPSAYISSPGAQGGHMFYLTASTNVGLGNDSVFPEANKWYMNERGVWHESFFFNG